MNCLHLCENCQACVTMKVACNLRSSLKPLKRLRSLPRCPSIQPGYDNRMPVICEQKEKEGFNLLPRSYYPFFPFSYLRIAGWFNETEDDAAPTSATSGPAYALFSRRPRPILSDRHDSRFEDNNRAMTFRERKRKLLGRNEEAIGSTMFLLVCLRGLGSRESFFFCIYRKYYRFSIKCRLVYSKIRKIVDLAVENFKRVFLESFFLLVFLLIAKEWKFRSTWKKSQDLQDVLHFPSNLWYGP